MTHAGQLRAWAEGSYPVEAGTELLLRGFGGRFAAGSNPWIHPARQAGSGRSAWIDFAAIPGNAGGGAWSGGERRFLLPAACLGDEVPVVLSEVLPGLDRETAELVLAAVSHAAGSHEHSGISVDKDGAPTGFTGLSALYPWPKVRAAGG